MTAVARPRGGRLPAGTRLRPNKLAAGDVGGGASAVATPRGGRRPAGTRRSSGVAAADMHQAAAPRGERLPVEPVREHASPGSSTATRPHLGCSASQAGSDGRGATTGPSTSLSPATRWSLSSSAAAAYRLHRRNEEWGSLARRRRPPPRAQRRCTAARDMNLWRETHFAGHIRGFSSEGCINGKNDHRIDGCPPVLNRQRKEGVRVRGARAQLRCQGKAGLVLWRGGSRSFEREGCSRELLYGTAGVRWRSWRSKWTRVGRLNNLFEGNVSQKK